MAKNNIVRNDGDFWAFAEKLEAKAAAKRANAAKSGNKGGKKK